MHKITTADGSKTFFNESVGDYYHSKSGALTESFEKYAEPTKIAELAKTGSLTILDVCFGVGYNTAAAIDAALEVNPNCKIKVFALEMDESILAKIPDMNPGFKNYDIIKQAYKSQESEKIQIKLLIGDARKTIKTIKDKVDAVFLDPFSPSKAPELWQAEFFKEIKTRMKKGAILATYSCARMVRDNLKEVGLIVSDGPCVGRRSPSTLAIAP